MICISFFSSVYLLPPNEEILRYIVAKSSLEELTLLFGGKAVADIRKFAATMNIDKELALLKQEYMELFAVPTGRYVTPFEDVYRGNNVDGSQIRGPLLGECAVKVKKMYRQAGSEIEKECKEVPTHIGVELSFMCFLCKMELEVIAGKEADASNDQEKREDTGLIRYRDFQIKFLEEHLNKWFPQLSKSIQTNSRSLYYSSLALITEQFLSQDTAILLANEN